MFLILLHICYFFHGHCQYHLVIFLRKCAYQKVGNVSFSKHFRYVQKGWSLYPWHFWLIWTWSWQMPGSSARCWCFHCMKSVQIPSLFRSVFSCIWNEYSVSWSKSPYSVVIQENMGHKKLRIWTLFKQCFEVKLVGSLIGLQLVTIWKVSTLYKCKRVIKCKMNSMFILIN